MRLLALALVVGSGLLQLVCAQQAFLQGQLPLKVQVTTPSSLASEGAAQPVTLTARQAITAVFSRPVIALGSDWGSQELEKELVPFTLSCGTPGRLRWVTTNIARFDPSVDWPSDLDCSFQWNKGLKTYDGAPLQLGDLRPSVQLQTQPLAMTVQQVQSEAAMAATGGQWSAMLGSPDDQLPEVPPDGNLTLSFSYPVELAQLAKSLKVSGTGAGGRTVAVSPCTTAQFTPLPLPIIFTAYGATQGASSSPADLLSLNSTCAVVKVVPGLEPGAAAVLRLPKGARYSPIAGPVAQDTDVNVYGLRPFRIPLRWDFMNRTGPQEQIYSGVTFRRLSMWLPHGLSKDTSLADLQASIQLCCLSDPFGALDSSCSKQAFDLSRPYPAELRMRVPALNPGQRCILRVKADPKVKDAFGLPLQASSDTWWTMDLDPAFTGPSVRQVALLEPAPGNPALNWPWVSRGTPEQGLRRVEALSVPVGSASSSSKDGSSGLLERALTSVLAGYGGTSSSILQSAGVKVSRKEATWPTFQSLTLSGQPGISLVGSCCRQVTWPSLHDALGSSALVVQTDLQAAFVEQGGQVVVWVTTTQGSSKAVEGARVQVYATVYGKESATAGPACITSADGSCLIDLAAAKAQQQKAAAASAAGDNSPFFQPSAESATYSAVITADGHGPLVVPDLPNSGRYHSSGPNKEYVATLVLDRKLVKPGDDLHVTAYIQRKEGSQLKVAQDLPSVVLQVSPGFDRPAGGSSGSNNGKTTPVRVTVKVDPKYGTAHAVIPVPKTATPANYNLQLWTPPVAGQPMQSAQPSNAAAAAPMVRPATVEALSNAAAANVKAAGSGRRLQGRAERPPVAVMPKPKQLMAAVPSDPGTAPPGVVSAVPAGLRQPNFDDAPADAALATDAVHDKDQALYNGSSRSASKRQLQQKPEELVDEVPAAVEVIPEPASQAEQPAVAVLEPAALPDTKPAAEPAMDGDAEEQPAELNSRPSNARLEPLGSNLASTTFTVGDPRPPTASLAVSTQSNWVKPDGSLTVSVTTKSYVGSDVSGAEVTLNWSTGKAEGELLLKTNSTGGAIGTVELSKLPAANRSEAGDSLTLKASWVGPTREPLSNSKTVKIADGPVRVELQRTLLTNVPGVLFGVKADAFSNEDDKPVKGATVDVSITPRNGSSSLTDCTTAQILSLAQQKCSIKAGDPSAAMACQLALPCAGDFVLKGCIAGSAGGCSKELRIGRNMSAWIAAPWSSGPGQMQLLADRKNVSLGEDVALTLQNPFWGPVSALVVWGNGEQREQFYLDEIPPGASTIVIQELGPECRGGCNVVVTLAVARPAGKPPGSTPPYVPPTVARSPSVPATAAAPATANPAPTTSSQPAQQQPAASNSASNKPASSPPASPPAATGSNTGSKAATNQPAQPPAASSSKATTNTPAQPPAASSNNISGGNKAGPAPAPAPVTGSRPAGTGFRPPVNSATPPRGLVGSGTASGGTSNSKHTSLIAEQKELYAKYIPANASVRTFSGLWPFNINVYNGQAAPAPAAGNTNTRGRSRVGLFGSRDSSNRGLMRMFAARNERGAVLSGASAAAQPAAAAAAAAAARSIPAVPDIPRSQLYDPYAPVTVSAEVSLSVPDADKLSVDVTVAGQSKDASGVAVLAPQSQQGSIKVSVKGGSGAAVPDAEVTLVVVDQAILDLMPYELQDVSGAMQPKLRAAFNLLHLNSLRVSRSAINATFTTLQRRLLSIDPWLPMDTTVSYQDGVSPMDADGDISWLPVAAAVDVPDDVYLQSFTSAVTPMPTRACPLGDLNCPQPMVGGHSHAQGIAMPLSATIVSADAAAPAAAPAPLPMNALTRSAKVTAEGASNAAAAGLGGSSAAGGASAGAQLRLQQAFRVTPLFKTVKTGSDGSVSVDFTAPDNLGRFVVRAYVAAPKAAAEAAAASGSNSGSSSAMAYGAGQSAVVVRRTVSLVPSLPRQVRVGDSFTAGVLVEAPGTVGEVAVVVSAAVQPPASGGSSKSSASSSVLSLEQDTSRIVTLSPGKPQQEVRFTFEADSIGVQNVTFTATANTGGLRAPTNRGLRRLLAAAEGSSSAAGAVRALRQFLANRRTDSTAAAAGNVADQVQLQVPVNGKQGGVVIATSFAVKGSSGGNSWQEGMALPRAESGSGSISLIAGVGSLPAIQAAYTSLADQGLDPACAQATQAVALSILPAFLSLYQQPGTPATSLFTTQQLQLTRTAAAAAATRLTHPKFGLLSVEPSCLSLGSQGPERADISLNAWATWLAQQARSSSSSSGNDNGNGSSAAAAGGELSPAWASISDASKTWTKAVENQLVADAVAARQGSRATKPGPFSDLESLAWARLVLGPGWSPTVSKPAAANAGEQDPAAAAAAPKDLSAEVRKDLSMQRLTATALAGNLTVGGQARVGLTLLKAPAGTSVTDAAGKALSAAEAAQRISKRLVGSIRVGGRTAYVATGEGARAAAGLSDQSMALAFLLAASDASTDNPLVPKLAAWVAQGAAPPPLFYAATTVSSSPWDAALRSQALTTYDSSTASLAPNLKLTVDAQPKPTLTSKRAPVTLLSASFTPESAGQLVSSSKGWDAVPSNSSLVFEAAGSGEASIAVALNFTPADLLPFPTYRGLWVQRALLLEQEGGGGLKAAAGGVGLGKIVTVAVQVTSPDDQSDVVVEALMPGGLEPQDPNVFTDADAATICGSSDDESPLDADSSSSNSGISIGIGPKRFVGGMAPMLPGPGGFVAAGRGGGGGFGGRAIWPMCPLQTTAPDRVTFRFAYLRAGTHTMRFKAVAATSGTFVLPPVKASVQQQPEVMGLSPAGVLTVCQAADGACGAASVTGAGAAGLTARQPAKPCPKDCNNNGVCNLVTGMCICDTGFTGEACGDVRKQ